MWLVEKFLAILKIIILGKKWGWTQLKINPRSSSRNREMDNLKNPIDFNWQSIESLCPLLIWMNKELGWVFIL